MSAQTKIVAAGSQPYTVPAEQYRAMCKVVAAARDVFYPICFNELGGKQHLMDALNELSDVYPLFGKRVERAA